MTDFYDFIDTFPEGVAILDSSLKIKKCNEIFTQICSEDKLNNEVKNAIKDSIKTNSIKEITVSDSKTLKFKVSPLANDNGATVIVEDITAASNLEKIRNEFTANLSHEFRTPLAIIKGSAELLADDALDTEEDKHRYYDRIITEATALEHLVRDLLDQSKLKAGKIELKIELLNAEELLDDIVEKMKPIAGNKKIKLEFIPSGAPDVAGDYDRLHQVAIIFIDNAIKFTPEGGTITVSTRYDDNNVYMSFKDSGMGIAEEDLPYVFERFYKVEKSKRNTETGSGLGLSIAWQIAQLHKGTITVDSTLGEGTTFTVSIPVWKD